MKSSKDEKNAVQILNNLGYKVTLRKPTTRKTFEVESATLAEFMRVQASSGMKVKEAIQEALYDWICKKSGGQS